MGIFQSIIAARLIFISSIINLLAGVLVLLSCRCISGTKITGKLMKYAAYQRFFRYHCYIWWALLVSVVVHAVFAITFLGVPF